MPSNSSSKVINLAIVGIGLVGSAFIDQVLTLRKPYADSVRILAISSSKKLVTASSRAPLKHDWQEKLASSSSKASIGDLLEYLKSIVETSSDGARTVLVDNTSSQDLAASYPSFLENGISVVTPNKKAFSSSLDLWRDISKAGGAGEGRVMNEATVGAGLPIIAPLKEMIATGDEITKIEGVFSGTLSYIFNEFSPVTPTSNRSPSFSEVVKVALDSGYTEPNPADDLSGSDVARKLTILSRLIPALSDRLSKGFEDVSTASLVPVPLQSFTGSGDEFITSLRAFDDQFAAQNTEAGKAGDVLRYVGTIDVGSQTIKASLDRYPRSHPFAASLKGSDNIVLFYTKRYGSNPLIVQGAGAGAAVTAMGVLGDVLKLAI